MSLDMMCDKCHKDITDWHDGESGHCTRCDRNLCGDCAKIWEDERGICLECSIESCIQDGKNVLEKNKQTTGKPRYSLLNFSAIEGIIAVREYGCKKYSDSDSWKSVPVQSFIDAAMRHLAEMQKGYLIDEESGLHHADHAACNLMFISAMQKIPGNGECRNCGGAA